MTRIQILLTAMIVSISHAQTVRTLRIEAKPGEGAPDTERFSVRVGEAGQDQASLWPSQRIAWMFWRTGDRQENRHHPESRGERSVSIDLAPIGASVVGVELDPVIETVPANEWRSFSERVSFVDGQAIDQEVMRVRHRESLATIVRAENDQSGASPIATSKLGLHAEIRPLLDPTRPGVGGDMPFRIYIGGVSVPNQRVIATHVESGETRIMTTRMGGFGQLRLDRPGDWRMEFHRTAPVEPANPLIGDTEPAQTLTDIDLISGVLTFTVRTEQIQEDQR